MRITNTAAPGVRARAAISRTGVAVVALVAAMACSSSEDAPPPASPARTAAGPAARPVRGTVHTIRMLLDDEGFRFDPSYLTVSEGDGVRFVMVSGVPHNVTFDEQFIPASARVQLAANLAALGARDLAAPVVATIDSAYVISTSGLPRGDYLFYCAPHRSLNMHGVLTVQ